MGLSLARFWRAFGISVGGFETPKPPFGTPLNKLATKTVPTAREAEVFRLKTLIMELWWNDTDRGKASTRVERYLSATWSTAIIRRHT